MDTHYLGGGSQCEFWDPLGYFNNDYSGEVDPLLCCDRDALSVKIRTLPIPLENLWEAEKLGPETDRQSWALTVDDGNSVIAPDYSLDPDDHAFGWHIFSGPEDKVTTLDKRDGSDWEVFDCEETKHEGRQSAKMVCRSDSPDSNCNIIWKGQVERTIIEMPSGCGPGK
jgi:chitinase